MINELKLIPELKDWKKENGDDFDLQDWVTCEGNIRLAIGYSTIFWPEFLEYDNCIFIKSHFSPDNYEEWTKSKSISDYRQIESVINHIHILDFFTFEKQNEINVEQVKYLGCILQEIYAAKLKTEFPNRKFTVTFNGKEKLEDLIEYQLTFYQENNKNRMIEKESQQ
ncbi:hypothetical protein [Flagellimonas sp.]|uniref:hypothetical protein n=1 Tax=Flagellimonas sp. TaxID=2058762 RepID=UPI003F4A5ED8